MKNYLNILFAALGIMHASICGAQENSSISESEIFRREFQTIELTSPNEWSFHKYIEKPVNLYNGSVDVSVPLYEIKDGEVSIPLTLRYNTSGIKVNEEASWIGLGWNLNVGGYITQRIVGGADEGDRMFDPLYKHVFYKPGYGFVHEHQRMEINSGMADTISRHNFQNPQDYIGKIQPDVYYFSYPGNAGRYIINHLDHSVIQLQREKDLLINNESTGNTPYDIFPGKMITTPEGLKHHYNDSYVTTLLGASFPLSISYPLTKTEYPNGSEVYYRYGAYHISKTTHSAMISGALANNYTLIGLMPDSPSTSHVLVNAEGILNDYSSITRGVTHLEIEETYLQEINTLNYRIVFVTENRQDIESTNADNPSKRLSGIRIIDKSTNQCIKAFRFGQTYFGNGTNVNNLRLKLDYICEVSPTDDSQEINRYEFSYNTDHELPAKDSYATDYWGYTNSNEDVASGYHFPNLKKLYWDRLDNDDYQKICRTDVYPTYDKSHNYDYCQSAVLTGITYPTGGMTKFEYGSNSFWGKKIPSRNEHLQDTPVVEHEISDRNSSVDSRSIPLSLPGRREIHINYKLFRGLNSWESLSDGHPQIIVPFSNAGATSGTLLDLSDRCWQMHINGDNSPFIEGNVVLDIPHSGLTVILVDFPDILGDQYHSNGNHGSLIASVRYMDAEQTAVEMIGESFGCGLRVESIKNYNADSNTPIMIRSYSYNDPESQRTSGILFDIPKYETIYNNAILPFRPGDDGPYYLPVKVFELSGSTVTTNPYGWSCGVGYGCVTETIEGIGAGQKEIHFINLPLGDSQDPVYAYPLNGKNYYEITKDADGEHIQELHFNYSHNESKRYYGVKLINNHHHGGNLINSSHSFVQNHPYLPDATAIFVPNCFEAIAYNLNQNDIYLHSVREVTDGVEKNTTYSVDTETMLVKTESFTDSDGKSIRTEYTYPSDYDSVPVYRTLSNKHIISPIIETRVLRDNKLVFSKLRTYDAWGNNNALYYSSITFTTSNNVPAFSGSQPNPSLYPLASSAVLEKDAMGNPIEISLNGAETELYLWGYNYRFPVARIKGATREQVEDILGCNMGLLSRTTNSNAMSIYAIRNALPTAQVDSYDYNPSGEITFIQNASNQRHTFNYDSFGRLVTKSRYNNETLDVSDEYSYTDTSITHRIYYSPTQFVEDICYYNGLGLPDQTLSVGASPDGRTLVQPYFYDGALRESRKYLPYALSNDSAEKRENTIAEDESFWRETDSRPFFEPLYEKSPLSRSIGEMKAGSAYWQNNKHTVASYRGNVINEVRMLSTHNSGGFISTGYYPSNTLSVITTIDEDLHKKAAFSNKMGLLVLERAYITDDDYADTYYIYDNFCNLAYVVTPEGSALLVTGTPYNNTSSLICDYCYRYNFDSRRRITKAQMPGGKYDLLGYDDMNRIILHRNNYDADRNSWRNYRYDTAGRLIDHKLFCIPVPDSYIQSNPVSFNATGNALESYSYDSYPDTNPDLLFMPVPGVVSTNDVRTTAYGLKTQEYIRDVDSTVYTTRRFFYDYLNRVVQKVEKTPSGDIIRTSWKYDYRDNVLTVFESVRDITKKQEFVYDNRSRLLSETTYINEVQQSRVDNTYDILNRPVEYTYGNGVSETRIYTIQGWLKRISATKLRTRILDMSFGYCSEEDSANSLFNGNIAWMRSIGHIPSSATRYTYSYDALNRLSGAEQLTGLAKHNALTEKDITYDKNGNILTLKRYIAGAVSNNLNFSYSGNKRVGYVYDSMGNITRKALDLCHITYNRLCRPSNVSCLGDFYSYSYLSDGTKTSEIDGNGNGFRYLGSMRFTVSPDGEEFESTCFSHGRIVNDHNTGTIAAQYFIADQIGSTRVVTNTEGTATAYYEYTPFGVMQSTGDTGPSGTDYTFSGKEKQRFDDVYDFGARLYDPRNAIWNAPDPKAEKYYFFSPYTYCINNPIIFVDPDGKRAIPLHNIFQNWTIKIDSWFGPRDIGKEGASFNHKGLDFNYSGGGDTDLGAPILASHEGFVTVDSRIPEEM